MERDPSPAISEGVEDKRPAAQNPGPSLVSNRPVLEEMPGQTRSPERGK